MMETGGCTHQEFGLVGEDFGFVVVSTAIKQA